MENGRYNYDIRMMTPLGKRRGNLELTVEGNFLNGYLTMFTRTVPIQRGRIVDGHITFSGDMRNLMKTLPYRAEGTANDTGVALTVTTELGEYPVFGELTQARGL